MLRDFFYKQCLGFLNTRPLWVNEQFGIQQFNFPDIDLDGFVPLPIPQNLRLGHQMEYVFKQLLDHCPEYVIILNSLAIKEDKRTIGEIDFILKQLSSEKYIHVELAYKFYIINLESKEPIHRLMGPNKRDTFFAKMEKINHYGLEIHSF